MENIAKFDVNEITFTEGRMYQKALYSLPYEIRQFLYPETDAEGKFYEVDLSNAELRLAGWFYKDEQLCADIDSGNFWQMWLSQYEGSGFTKGKMKKCLFCMAYSCSDVTFPPQTPSSFMEDFCTRYQTWWLGINRTKQAAEFSVNKLRASYKNWVTGAPIQLPASDAHHFTFIALNYRVQQSLSSYAEILYASVAKRVAQEGGQCYCINFDSVFCTAPNRNLGQFMQLVSEEEDRLVAEGLLPCKIPFKGCEGQNMAEAQGWEGSDIL